MNDLKGLLIKDSISNGENKYLDFNLVEIFGLLGIDSVNSLWEIFIEECASASEDESAVEKLYEISDQKIIIKGIELIEIMKKIIQVSEGNSVA